MRVFQQLISTVLQTGGLAIAQDADLSDISLDYLKVLASDRVEPWVVINDWKPQLGWDVSFVDAANPTLLIQQLELDLIAGKKCYVTTDSRSGKYSSETIDIYIKQRLEQFVRKYPKTLVVSSQTTRTIDHEAVDFVEDINQKVFKYDAVFVTPSLGTGVSIDGSHFDRVYGIFIGVIPDWEARQALARVRANVPRIVWCGKKGIGTIGSGSKNYRLLADWYRDNHKENLALMCPLHRFDIDLPLVYDPIHLRTWAKFAARVNNSIWLYRQVLLEGLIAEGHCVNIITDVAPTERIKELRHLFITIDPANENVRKNLILEIVKLQKEFEVFNSKARAIKSQIKKIRSNSEWQSALAVANAEEIDREEYEKLLVKRSLTDREHHKIEKYKLQQLYGIEVTPQLKQRHDRGYYAQLLLHYYLTHETEYFYIKDRQEWQDRLYQGEGKVFLPDLNTYTLKVELLRDLGIPNLLNGNRDFYEDEFELLALRFNARRLSKQIERTIGLEIDDANPIRIFRKILNLLGLKLKPINLVKDRKLNKLKFYRIDPNTFNDGREEIFKVWNCRDMLTLDWYRSNHKTPILVL